MHSSNARCETLNMQPSVKSAMNLVLTSGWAVTLYIAGLIVVTVAS